MSVVDLVLVACVVAVAAIYLAWAMLGHRSAPACHDPAATAARKGGAAGPDVVIGAGLQRGLDAVADRARARSTAAR